MGLVDILRLPSAHMDLGLVRIAEVPDHEYVALVAIARGVPVLEYGDAIDVVYSGMLHDGDIVEGHLDILIAVEGSLQVGEVLPLVLFPVDDTLACWFQLGLAYLDDATGDDECIEGEHLVQELQVLLVVSGAEVLHVVENHHAVADVGHLTAAVLHLFPAQVGVELGVDGIVETGDDARLVQIDDSLLVGVLVAALIGLDAEGDAPYLKAFARGEQRTHDFLVDAAEMLVAP